MKRKPLLRLTMLLTLAALGAKAWPARAEVAYRLAYRPSASGVEVTLTLPDPRPAPQTLIMPRAVPMGYGEQPYDRFVDKVRAFSESGESLDVLPDGEGPRWSLGAAGNRLARVVYEVDVGAMEAAILSAADTSKARPGYAGLLGYSVFAFVDGLETEPIRLTIEAPQDWSIFSTLRPTVPAPQGSLEAEADDFYALADSQIVLGPEARFLRLDAVVPLFLAVYAEGEIDVDLMGRLAAETMDQVVAYFDAAPFEHYSVLLELLRPISERHDYDFSMEHLDSSTYSLHESRGVTESTPPRELQRTRYNFAHHFIHSWIPKRVYGEAGYFPFNWELAPLLETIWFSEGFAQYAALDALADAMPAPQAETYRRELLARRFERTLEEAPRFLREMSLAELSRVASTRYSQDFRTGRNVFSRGALMAAEMDTKIRQDSLGRRRLRDGLRALVAWGLENRRPFRLEDLRFIFRDATGIETWAVLLKWQEPLAE